ncbi:hypothetical protein CY34DRAFT_186204 [Suillus luteus UH-Slu-Lm8-n1]|uniref:Uncharacterized protein n=1 Tax=Suillus luteus UH-Slu-Lm8-n1 TaxID=930992 RepID=A0A0D0AV68_9AGAM|nr:hypothetical protein CY34DRAFT_186204 [Suillus luteus UH-Slu-Lm8-n1]
MILGLSKRSRRLSLCHVFTIIEITLNAPVQGGLTSPRAPGVTITVNNRYKIPQNGQPPIKSVAALSNLYSQFKVCPWIAWSAPLLKLKGTSVSGAVVLLIPYVLLGFHFVGLELVLKVTPCSG